MTESDLAEIERGTFRLAHSDGLIDLFLGASLLLMGATWIWLPDVSGMAGVWPAVLLSALVPVRRAIVQERLGYVRWSPSRQRWQRRLMLLALFGGVLMLLGVGTFLVVQNGELAPGSWAAGLIAWLLAIMVAVGAVLIDAARFYVYAGILALGGMVVAVLDANPGWALTPAGAVAAIVGVWLFVSFVRRFPRHSETDAP